MANGDTGAVGGLSQAEMQAIREEAIALQNTIGGIGSQFLLKITRPLRVSRPLILQSRQGLVRPQQISKA